MAPLTLQNDFCNYYLLSKDDKMFDPSLWIESFAIINLRGVSTKLN